MCTEKMLSTGNTRKRDTLILHCLPGILRKGDNLLTRNTRKGNISSFVNQCIIFELNFFCLFRYKKNMKAFYIIHPTWWSKVSFNSVF